MKWGIALVCAIIALFILIMCSYCTILPSAGRTMPEIVRLSNCKISIYVRGEHPLPHFHIRGPDSNGSVVIATLELLVGRVSRKDLAEVRGWASVPKNMGVLTEAWRMLHERE
jgi:hypothetical protein